MNASASNLNESYPHVVVILIIIRPGGGGLGSPHGAAISKHCLLSVCCTMVANIFSFPRKSKTAVCEKTAVCYSGTITLVAEEVLAKVCLSAITICSSHPSIHPRRPGPSALFVFDIKRKDLQAIATANVSPDAVQPTSAVLLPFADEILVRKGEILFVSSRTVEFFADLRRCFSGGNAHRDTLLLGCNNSSK